MNISALPIGRYADGSPVLINLESRNGLMNGNPRSGKSVCLDVLICDLLRCENERLIVMSPKALDFQAFAQVVDLVQDPQDMLDKLSELHDVSEARKEWCVENRRKKLTPYDFSPELPHYTVIIDEYTVVVKSTSLDDKGRVVRIGAQIEQAVMKMIAETGFAGISFMLCLQRASSTNMDTNIRDLIAGPRISFASSSVETDRMVFGDLADKAPCHRIGASQKGVGYVSIDGADPQPFKGAMASDEDEDDAVRFALSRGGRDA